MRLNRRQLSLRQILFSTGLLSVIFTLAGPGKLPMSETLLLVASFGVAVGLRQQGLDIDVALRGADAPTDPHLVQAWRFEKNWRYFLASSVLIGWIFAALIAQGIFGSTNRETSDYRDSPSNYGDGLIMLVIVVGLASSVVRWRSSPQTLFAKWVHRTGWAAAIALLVVLCVRDIALIDALVHVAIRGIEMAQPEPYGETFFAGGVWVYESNVTRFAWLQLALAGLVFMNVSMLIRMTDSHAKRWTRLGYTISIALAMGIALWNRVYGFASIAPIQAGTPAFWIAHIWLAAIPLIVLFGFSATYRLLAHPAQSFGSGPTWRPTGKIYLSESWYVMAVAALGSIWHCLTDAFYFASLVSSRANAALKALEILASPAHYFHLAVLAACLQLTVVRMGGRPLAGQVPVELNLSQFALTWIAVMMTTYVTLEAAMGTSFVYWIVPWEPFPFF